MGQLRRHAPLFPPGGGGGKCAAGWLLTLFVAGCAAWGSQLGEAWPPWRCWAGWWRWCCVPGRLFPYFFRVGVEKARMYLIVFFVLLLVMGAGLAGLLDAAVPTLPTLLALAPVGVVVGAVVCLASVPAAVGQYLRRNW
ncbi:MAG: hypothetical protein ACLR6W_10160 [Evtepia sp.]